MGFTENGSQRRRPNRLGVWTRMGWVGITEWVGIMGLVGLTGCMQASSKPATPAIEQLPQDGDIQIWMNHNQARFYQEPYRPQIERAGDDLEQVILEAIAAARTSIDIAVQELRLPRVAQALAHRHRQGIQVRLILENTYALPTSQQQPENLAEAERARHRENVLLIDQDRDLQLSPTEIAQHDALAILDQHQVPRLDDTADGSAGSGLMHHKFMVVDRQVVVTGSANWTMSDIHGDLGQASSRGNANNLLTIRSAALAQHFTQEFDLMWGDGPGQKPNSRFGLQKPNRGVQTLQVGKSLIQLQFSPTSPTRPWSQSSNGLIGQTLVRSRRSVDLALFVFSDQTLADQLQTLQSRNVQMRTLIDPGFAYRPYSELLDQLGVSLADSQCRYEANNRPWKTPISGGGVPRLWPGDKLHHKFGVVDQRWVITGSQNWSEAANHQNDETLMVIHNPVIAAHYQREFDRLNQAAILGLPPAVLKKQQRQANSCRTAR